MASPAGRLALVGRKSEETRIRSAAPANEETKTRQTTNRARLSVALLLATVVGVLLSVPAPAQVREPSRIQRTETSTFSPFGPFREKSSQRLTYNHQTPWLVSELDFRHVIFKDFKGVAPRLNQLWQASFFGRNLSTPLEFKAGRIWTGNHSFRPVDGVSWWYPWGRRLSTTLDIGKTAKVDAKTRAESPDWFEGRLHYAFNDEAYLAVQGGQDYKTRFSSALVGWQIETLKLQGEYASSGATDTWRLGLQYYDQHKVDLTGDYRLFHNAVTDSGVARNLIGVELGTFYLETGVGGRFFFGDDPLPRSTFYEGTLTWGAPKQGKDTLSVGYLLETSPASTAHTLSASAQRNVTKRTRISLEVASTRFGGDDDSLQNLESRLHRRVDWGYYELKFAVISGGGYSELQKDVGVRAGYEF